jgi:hypothetical protein
MSMMPSTQRNLYKGSVPRCWIRIRFAAPDGTLHERELLVDTGSPCAVIIGTADLALLSLGKVRGIDTNFGHLAGGWLELATPELGLTKLVPGFGSDLVLQSVQSDSSEFAGLVGLPLLRLVEYGGDNEAFWVRKLELDS